MEKLKKLIDKKRQEGKGSLGEVESAARGSVLQDMIGALDSEGAKKVKGIKKVTVTSGSTGGIEKGLDVAKKALQKHEGEMKPDTQEPEYNDQDAEGPNHMPTEKEASSFGSQDPELGSPKTDENEIESEEGEGSEEDELSSLKAEHEKLKEEIARLKAPKSYY